MRRALAIAAIALLPAAAAAAPTLRAGDVYEIVSVRDSAESTGAESTGSSHDRDAIIERVVAVRGDGLELEFDLPKEATADDRARTWQFPVRVLKPAQGPMQLLNRPELEARIDTWLKAASQTRAACGQWYFTWSAFQIQCDPQSVIGGIEPFDLDAVELREGALYQPHGAKAAAPFKKTSASTFTAEAPLDPESVRGEEAQADVVIGEIMKKPVTLEDALRARSGEQISGTITVTFDSDATGRVRRRTEVTKLEIKGASDQSEVRTTKETVERRLISHR